MTALRWFDAADLSDPPASAPRKKRDHAEWGLSHWVDTFLERCLLTEVPTWFTAIEAGTWMPGASREARMNAENKRRARGVKPSHLDWYVYQSPLFAQIELKVQGRSARNGQTATMTALRRANIPTAVCETVPEVCAFLTRSGFRLHGNAVNIAAELHERFLAERRKKG